VSDGGGLRDIAPIRRVLGWQWVARLASTRTLARLVDASLRFALRELSGARRTAAYRVRELGAHVVVRHNSTDIWTLNEVFNLRSYDAPPPVAMRLRSLGRPPRVLDLGANVGMFGALVCARHPGAEIVAFEPDPRNAAVHRRCMELNGAPPGWKLVEACAASRDGVRPFLATGDDSAHVVPEGAGTAVPARDVLPLMETSDLVKIDIEGSEWELLGDSRFGSAPAVVLEYHPGGCPTADPHAEAERLLAGIGYEVQSVYRMPSGLGVVWAWR
jgi:FkbM family methyltransferase